MLTKYWYVHSKIKMHSKFLVHMNIRSIFLRAKLSMHYSYIPVLIQYTVILNGNMTYIKKNCKVSEHLPRTQYWWSFKRVFKKLGFEYVNLLYLALSRTFNLQIIKLFFNLHSIFFFFSNNRLLVRILNSSMSTIEMHSMLMNAQI